MEFSDLYIKTPLLPKSRYNVSTSPATMLSQAQWTEAPQTVRLDNASLPQVSVAFVMAAR